MVKNVWFKALIVVALLLICASPVLADNGEDGQVVFGENYVLEPGEVLVGDLVVFGGSVDLLEESVVTGDVVVFGGSGAAAGRIEGNLAVLGGRLVLESTAVVEGDLVALGNLEREDGSRVLGDVVGSGNWDFRDLRGTWDMPRFRVYPTQNFPFGVGSDFWSNRAFSFLRWIITTLGLVAIGVLIVLFIPKQAGTVGAVMIQSPLISLGFGALTAVVLTLLIPILIVICIGIPVAILLFVAGGLAILYGWLVAGQLVGARVRETLKLADPPPLLDVVIGVPILALLSAIPCLGTLFAILVAMWGLGAVVLTRAGMMPYSPQRPSGTTGAVVTEAASPAAVEETVPGEDEEPILELESPSEAEETSSEEETPEE